MDSRATSTVRYGKCNIFCNGEEKELVPKQKGCDVCVRDVLTMRRDAKAAGKEAVKVLADAEKPGNEKLLVEIHTEWSKVVAACVGSRR